MKDTLMQSSFCPPPASKSFFIPVERRQSAEFHKKAFFLAESKGAIAAAYPEKALMLPLSTKINRHNALDIRRFGRIYFTASATR
jgi:hypothetical protein